MLRPLSLMAACFTAACVNTTEFASRSAPPDYGSAIAQTQCQDIARRHVGVTLLKPQTARYKWGRCMADTLAPKPLLGLPKQSGYAMSFEVDAQNAWGKYTGYRSYEILIRDGKVVRRTRRSAETGMWETF